MRWSIDIDIERMMCAFSTHSYFSSISSTLSFDNRAFWFQCLPLLLMSACTTILSFICYRYGLSIDGHEGDVEIIETKQWMTLSIGILGIISTVLTSIMINTKYQAQQSMHAAAERSLSKICQQVRFPDGSKSLVDHINTQKQSI